MLKIKMSDQPKEQFWDETNECFVYKEGIKGCELTLEHSLLSISKWETIWCKPFLNADEFTIDELLSYVECMTVAPSNPDPAIYKRLTQAQLDEINTYINHPATATTFGGNKPKSRSRNEIITSEIVYYMMIQYDIPFECQKWRFNRLLTLIRVCEIKNEEANGKKSNRNASDLRREYDRLNDIRRAKMKTKG